MRLTWLTDTQVAVLDATLAQVEWAKREAKLDSPDKLDRRSALPEKLEQLASALENAEDTVREVLRGDYVE
jgi:hypothetical protein